MCALWFQAALMITFASLIVESTTGVGLAAGSVAVGGFIAHVTPVLQSKDDQAVQLATVIGGVGGLFYAAVVVVIDKLMV